MKCEAGRETFEGYHKDDNTACGGDRFVYTQLVPSAREYFPVWEGEQDERLSNGLQSVEYWALGQQTCHKYSVIHGVMPPTSRFLGEDILTYEEQGALDGHWRVLGYLLKGDDGSRFVQGSGLCWQDGFPKYTEPVHG